MEAAALGEPPPPNASEAGNWSAGAGAPPASRVWSGTALASQALLLLLIFGLSALGNGAVLLLIARHRQLRTVPNAFVLSLALAELLGALLCLPPAFASLLAGRPPGAWLFGTRLCRASAALHAALGIAATLTMALLAFDRYCAIARRRPPPSKQLGRRRAARLLASAWMAALALAGPWYLLLPPPPPRAGEAAPPDRDPRDPPSPPAACPYVLPWGGSSSSSSAYSAALIVLGYLLPFALMCFCHYNICRAVRLSESRVRPIALPCAAGGAAAAAGPLLLRFSGELRTATTVLLMVVSIICCWGPYCVLGLAAAAGRLAFSPTLDAAACWMAWANGAINPLIYAARNPNLALLLRRNRQGGYRTGGAAAAAAATRPLQQLAKSRRAARYASSIVHGQQQHQGGAPPPGGALTSPGSGGGELTMWACKNPAVLFCRDAKAPAGSQQQQQQQQQPKAGAFDTSL